MFYVGTQDDVITLLQGYLDAAKRNEFQSIGIISLGNDGTHSKQTIVQEATDSPSMVGLANLLRAEIEGATILLEEEANQEVTALTESADEGNPQ